MKKVLLIIVVTIFVFGCKKDINNNNNVIGAWAFKTWNSSMAGGFLYLNSNGTYSCDMSYMGPNGFVRSAVEGGTYIKSSNEISFTRTSGIIFISYGNPWTINTLDTHNLKITNVYGSEAVLEK